MYIISDRDMEQCLEYIAIARENLTSRKLRVLNKARLADMLTKKLTAKQPFPLSLLPDDVQREMRKIGNV